MAGLLSKLLDNFKRNLSAGARVLLPDDVGYGESVARWGMNSEQRASLTILPTNSQDIAHSILLAKSLGLELAVCGGGHSTAGLSSTTGLLINLSLMRSVVVNPSESEQRSVEVGGGALWRDVDEELAKHGLATPGGTVNHTGVGGLTLGGGYGYLSGQYGLTIDNLLEVEMVLASGQVVVLSAESKGLGEELWWGAKGAGSVLGVASRFVFKVHEQKPEIWGGIVWYEPGPETLKKLTDFANGLMKGDGSAACFIAFGTEPEGPFEGKVGLHMLCFFNGTETQGKEYFAPILGLPGQRTDGTKMRPYGEMNGLLNKMQDHGLRRMIKGSVFWDPVPLAYIQECWDEFESFMAGNPAVSKSVVIFEFVGYQETVKAGLAEGGGGCFANRGEYGNVIFTAGWEGEEHDVQSREWTSRMGNIGEKWFLLGKQEREERVGGVKVDGVGQYGNYDGLGSPASKVFGVNFQRLKALKKVVDPGDMFRGPSFQAEEVFKPHFGGRRESTVEEVKLAVREEMGNYWHKIRVDLK